MLRRSLLGIAVCAALVLVPGTGNAKTTFEADGFVVNESVGECSMSLVDDDGMLSLVATRTALMLGGSVGNNLGSTELRVYHNSDMFPVHTLNIEAINGDLVSVIGKPSQFIAAAEDLLRDNVAIKGYKQLYFSGHEVRFNELTPSARNGAMKAMNECATKLQPKL